MLKGNGSVRQPLIAGQVTMIAVLFGLTGTGNGAMVNGQLKVMDYVGAYSATTYLNNTSASGVTDAYNIGYDSKYIAPLNGRPGCYSNISAYESNSANQKVTTDTRLPTTSHNTFDLELVFNGTNSSSTNYFAFSFPTSDVFGNEVLTLQQTDSSGSVIGSSYDIRQIVAGTLGGTLNPSAGRFNLPDLSIGAHSVSTPYAYYRVSISEALAAIGITNATNATIITGGTGTLGATVTNSATLGSNNLNYTLAAAVQSGSATLGSVTPNSGTLAPSASQASTVSATSTNLGVNTITFTASDASASNSPQTINATLTVKDHSNASLSLTASQTTTTINFGNVLKGATVASQPFTVYNRAANTTADNTADLKLTDVSATGDAALGTTLTTFQHLAAGNGNTYSATLNTSSYTTTGSKTLSMAGANLADDSNLSGAGSNNVGALSVTLQGNVGNATAAKNNSTSSFGDALTATVANNTTYANLESKVTATSGTGGYAMVGSTATLLSGTNSSGSSQTVTMAWRTQTQAERAAPNLISDILRLGGMATGETAKTSPFVLQIDYDPALLPGGSGTEATRASQKAIYLAWRNTSTGTWENAVLGNFSSNANNFHQGAWPAGDMTVGDWGVNTANHTAWAVLNYQGNFAVVPEPSTTVLAAIAAAVGLLMFRRRRSRQHGVDCE